MKWSSITYSRTYKIADYQSETIAVNYTADEHEDMGCDEALEYAATNVAVIHGKLHAARPITGQATVSTKVSGVSTQVPLPGAGQVTRQAPRETPPAAQGKTYKPMAPNALAALLAQPYAISLPWPEGAPIAVDQAKVYLKGLGYKWAPKKEGGNNCWCGALYPADMPELEPYIVKRPAVEGVEAAMGSDDVPF